GVMDPRPLKILLVASEAVPFAKTGGLADVAGGLPRELARLGHSVRLVIPRYGSIDGSTAGFKDWIRLAVPTATGRTNVTIEQGQLADSGVQILAVRHDPYFDREGLYQESGVDYPDNLERFAFFCRAVLELLPALRKVSGWTPDLLHAHDWQTALILVYLKTLYARSLLMNGIDTEVWDPATDQHVASRYSVSDLAGKRTCKTELERELRLPVRDVPLLAVVSRFTQQKGLDLVAELLPELMELDLQVALLGTGDPYYEALFRSLQVRYPEKIGLRIGFDDVLAHRIEVGGDMFLMPSRYEPCGLSQLYSLRYGTVPIVRR